jgi:hypothetical protein
MAGEVELVDAVESEAGRAIQDTQEPRQNNVSFFLFAARVDFVVPFTVETIQL